MDDKFSNARKNLKNYNLNEWRLNLQNIQRQAVDINKLVSQYDASYGRFLKAVIGIEQLAPEEMTKDLSPSEQVEKIFETASGTEQSQITNVVKNDIKSMMGLSTWAKLDRRHEWYEQNPISGEIRVKNDKLDQLKKHIKPVQLDSGNVAYSVNREAKGKLAPWIETLLGDKAWEKSKQDEEWIYFKPIETSSQPDLKETEVEEEVPEKITEIAPESAYSAEPELQEVPSEVFEGEMPIENLQGITDEDIVGEEELPGGPTTEKSQVQITTKPNRRKIPRHERGEVLAKPKKGGTPRWMSQFNFNKNKDEFDFVPVAVVKSKDGNTKAIPQELYEQNKDKYELVRLITEENTMGERIARLMELLIKEG